MIASRAASAAIGEGTSSVCNRYATGMHMMVRDDVIIEEREVEAAEVAVTAESDDEVAYIAATAAMT